MSGNSRPSGSQQGYRDEGCETRKRINIMKGYSAGDPVAIHSHPVWQARSNFILDAPVDMGDHVARWEQLWARKLGGGQFLICCVPFFTYGLALGDVVSKTLNGDLRVLVPSDQATIRALFGKRLNAGASNIAIAQGLEALSAMFEWSSPELLAISVKRGVAVNALVAYLEQVSYGSESVVEIELDRA